MLSRTFRFVHPRRSVPATVAAVAVGLLACKSHGDAAKPIFHCYSEAAHTCTTYFVFKEPNRPVVEDVCRKLKGSLVDACPTSGVAGCCAAGAAIVVAEGLDAASAGGLQVPKEPAYQTCWYAPEGPHEDTCGKLKGEFSKTPR
jgi:hypothetical protein